MDKFKDLWAKSSEMVGRISDDDQQITEVMLELEATLGQLYALEQELTKQKLNFESLFRNAHDAVVMFDHEHNVIDTNHQFEKMFGYTIEEMRGENLDLFVMPKEKLEEAQNITSQVFEGTKVITEGIRFNKNGDALEVAIQGVPMVMGSTIVGGFGIYTDISDRKTRERELAYMSDHDYLTQLFNRRFFDMKLAEYRHSDFMPLGFVIMDINGLKLINDAFGHDVGDQLLIEVANRLSPYSYDGNIIARLGSDEYGILCPNVTNELMENMSRQIKKIFSNLKTNNVLISTSVGWAIQFDTAESQRMLIKTAEDYMNRNKLFAAPSIRGNTVYAIVNTLHEKNAREEQHSRRVGALSQKLGEMLGLSARELSELIAMGTLHESWDGSGYPRGLVGAKIPYLSRVIAIADAFDAMTSDRSYRDAIGRDAALNELIRCSGKQFDPEIVKVFVSKIDYIE